MDKLKERIGREVESLADGLFAVSDFLLTNPEIAYQEFKARDYLCRMLEHKGFDVEKGVSLKVLEQTEMANNAIDSDEE